MSFFSWLDYSEQERQKALTVLSAFRERDTRDELGIGIIRDAFSDMLFPGTNTIQTRARYYLFVPWIYRRLEARRTPAAEMARRARAEEVLLMGALVASEDSEGTIGASAMAGLQRLPSSIYWHGLGVRGIRLFEGSQDDYHRAADRFHARRAASSRDDDGEPLDTRGSPNWDPGLPPAPEGFPHRASFRLTRQEAEYLHDRIMLRVPNTLLAFLVDRSRPVERVDFPWLHPQAADFPPRVQEQLGHARNFSEVMHGGALVYNLMVSELKEDDERVGRYREWIDAWWSDLTTPGEQLHAWDRAGFWHLLQSVGAHVTPLTRRFVDAWVGIVLNAPGADDVARSGRARALIRDRERQLKGSRAPLHNRRALERWRGASSVAQLNYRWRTVQAEIADMLAGLGREG